MALHLGTCGEIDVYTSCNRLFKKLETKLLGYSDFLRLFGVYCLADRYKRGAAFNFTFSVALLVLGVDFAGIRLHYANTALVCFITGR